MYFVAAEYQLVAVLNRLRTSVNTVCRRATSASVGFPEKGLVEHCFARGAPRDSEELAAFVVQVHELEIEMAFRRRPSVGAHAEAVVVDVFFDIRADHVHQENLAAEVLVIGVAVGVPREESILVEYAFDVAGADAEDRDLTELPFLFHLWLRSDRYPEKPLNVREYVALRRIIRIGKMELDRSSIGVGYLVEEGVPALSGKRSRHQVSVMLEKIHDPHQIAFVDESTAHISLPSPSSRERPGRPSDCTRRAIAALPPAGRRAHTRFRSEFRRLPARPPPLRRPGKRF